MEYKIAVTMSAGDIVDLHFGQADNFSIYTVDSESGEYTFSEKRVIDKACIPDPPASNSGCSCNSARAEYVAKLLSDCAYLLTEKIGGRQQDFLLGYGLNTLETPYPLEYAVKKLNEYKQNQLRREQ
jgi:predicted Fe-Mo cluster-binding NifX family protein